MAYKSLSGTIKILKQHGKSDLIRDSGRIASSPGQRISKTGHIYWETRKNRSDNMGGNT